MELHGSACPGDGGTHHLAVRAAATTTVSGIEHIESQTLAGLGIVKVFMQPGVSMADAVALQTAEGIHPSVLARRSWKGCWRRRATVQFSKVTSL